MADIAASVLTRLKNKAQASGRSYQLCLQLFCQEEFLRRLEKSKYAKNFVLKGGLFIYSLTEFDSRVTVDVDFLLRQMPNTPEQLRVVLEEIIAAPTENKFVTFEITDVAPIAVAKKYAGISASLVAYIKNIEEKKITVKEVTEGYFNDAEEGVVGYDEQLDIRPKYQREFVYKDEQRNEVIRTVMKGLPLNVMYWVDRGEEFEDDPDTPRYEVMDGQQRTISLCEYVDGNFSVDDMLFVNLPKDKQDEILDYELFIYICNGTESEKLDWFRIINIAGEQLTDQELRNAVYAGSWTSDAKRYFSKSGCAADRLAGDYLKGSSIRQEYLEMAILWAASAEGKTIEGYMSEHQHDPSAVTLWNYFRSVIDWV